MLYTGSCSARLVQKGDLQERPDLTGLKASTGKPVIDARSSLGLCDRFLHGGPYQLEQVLTGHIGAVSLAGAQDGARHEYEIRHIFDTRNVELSSGRIDWKARYTTSSQEQM